MKFNLIRPCPKCPFRSDIPFYLSRDRAREIADSILGGFTFPCHETVDYSEECWDEDEEFYTYQGNEHHCAGALLVLEKMGILDQNGIGAHNLLQIAERIGLLDRSKLDRSTPVYDSLDTWVNAQHIRE